MNKIWKIINSDKDVINKLSKNLGMHPITALILANRGFCDFKEAISFMNISLKQLNDPFKIKDMHKAVERIIKAIKDNETILIYGDYDVDGITGVALLVRFLRILGANIRWYIPNRISEGYGLGEGGVKYSQKIKANLIITVDCGILAFKQVEKLNSLKTDVIITDHHQPDNILPKAYAILNPMRYDCEYPYRELSGVGVAYKLCQAVYEKFKPENFDILDLLDIVALGTVSDVSPMTGENRILVKYGLSILNKFKNPGLKALAEVSRFKKTVDTAHISFIFGPRINASGRLGMADKGLELLLIEDFKEAKKVARILDKNNKTRQDIQNKTFKEAVIQSEETIDFSTNRVLVVYNPDWHPGVLGIVASKLTEKYYRPSLVFCGKEDIIQGSGRSIEGFNLYKAVSCCRDYLESFGGHEAACGITIKKEKLLEFTKHINKIANIEINLQDFTPSIYIDACINLSDLNKDLINQLDKIAPFGPKNPQPVFCSLDLHLKQKPKFLKKNGVKMWISDGRYTYQAIGFGKEICKKAQEIKTKLHIAYSPYIEEWEGRKSIGLKIKDIK